MANKLGETYKQGLDELKRQHDLKLQSQQAVIDLANKKQSWGQRNPLLANIISAIVGGTIMYIIERLL